MTKWADRAIEEAKKRKSVSEPKHQTTNVSSPIRGANQDQSGYGVSHSVADYTISDETIHEIVAGVGAIRSTPVTMQSTPRGKKSANAPASAGRMQRSADIRRRQLDTFAQQQKNQQKQERIRQQQKRQAAQEKRQMHEEYEVVKHPTYGKVLSKGGKTVTANYDTADSYAAKHKGASLIKSLDPKKYHVKMPEHMPVGQIKESTLVPFKFFKEADDSSATTTAPSAKLSQRTSGVSSNKDFNLSWAKASQSMRDMQQKMTGSMSAVNYNRNKPETGGNVPEPPKVTQAPAGAPDKASSGPSVAPPPPSDNLSSIKKAVQTYTPEPIKTAIKSADKATGGALGDVGGVITKGVSGAADLISKGASSAGKAIQSFGDKLSDLTGIRDPNRPKSEEKKMKTEEKISRFVDFISEEEKKKRGRPPKATTDTGEEAAEKRHSLVAQFRDRKPDASGHYSVDVDGSSHRIHTSHAQRFLSAHGAARTADQKDAVERKFKSEIKGKK